MPRTQSPSEHRVYLPATLDLGRLPQRQRHCAEWLVHTLFTQRTRRKLHRDDFVNLQSEILERMMGHSYRETIETLLGANVIECDRHYIIGRKSLGYRLSLPYRDEQHRCGHIHNRPLAKKLGLAKSEQMRTWSEVHRCLYDCLQRTELPVDPQQHSQSLAIARIQDRDFSMGVCDYGRVHTNITILRKDLRKHLTIDGERLVEVDISCSQPLLLSLVVHDYLTNNGKLTYQNRSKKQQKNSSRDSMLLCTPFCTYGTKEEIPLDLFSYQEHCESGTLYSHLHSLLPMDDIKTKVLSRVLYAKNKYQDNPLSAIFAELFPSVMACIRSLKRKDYRFLPRHLQRVESDLVVHRICGRLMADSIPVLTVHDSILTPLRHLDQVVRVMREESAEVGISPTLKIKGVE